MHGSASHDKRQNDMYRSVKTLDQLKEQLKSDGLVISRSGLYLRLQGFNHDTVHPLKVNVTLRQFLLN